MGTDIHVVFQKRTPEGWEDVPHNYSEDRHYFLFAWLGDVRNGFGFAGVRTFNRLNPLSSRRGVPEDFVWDGDTHPVSSLEVFGLRRREFHGEDEPLGIWMGDHSHSWLSADEILNAPSIGTFWCTGVLKIEDFLQWDGKSEPEHYSGGVMGDGIKVAPSPVDVDEACTHVQVYFTKNQDESVKYFVDEVRRLKELHGDVRMVFGFDS